MFEDDIEEIDLLDEEYVPEAEVLSFDSPLYLEVEGVLITEELQMIMALTKKEVVNQDKVMPLNILFDGQTSYIGDMELNLDNLVNLIALCPNYRICIVNRADKQKVILYEKGNKRSLEELVRFISLV